MPASRSLSHFLRLLALLALSTLACGRILSRSPSDSPAATGPAHYVYFGGKTDLAVFSLEIATGKLSEKARTPMGGRMVYLALHPNRRWLYAGNGEPPGKVYAFAIAPISGLIAPIGDASTADEGDALGISHVAVHPSGKWVMTAHLKSGRVSVLPIDPGGGVSGPIDTRIYAVGAHQIVADKTGRYVFVPVRDGQFVGQFVVGDDGRLTPQDPERITTEAGAGPRHIAFAPGNAFAYVNNESNGTVTAYRHDGAGRLTPIESVPSVPPDFKETGMGHVLVHPSGRFVYASNRFHDSIVAYATNPETGRLTLIEIEKAGGNIKFPRDFDIDPSGRLMVVASERGDSLQALRIDAATGELAPVGPPASAPAGPQVVVIAPL